MDLEKRINFSIDKLTVLGQLKCSDYYKLIVEYAKYNESFIFRYIETSFYTHSFSIDGLGFLQIDRSTLNFRLEFNPNKIVTTESKQLLNELLSYVKNYHFSRIDLALDLYNYNLYDYNIIDLARRKKAYYYDIVGRLETCYFGSLSSNKFIRIYNKAREQKKDDLDWWRIELQLRDDYIDTYLTGLKDFLDGLFIFKYVSLENFSVKDKAILNYILQDIHRLVEFNKNTRTKYRKIFRTLELESLDFINDFMQYSYTNVIKYLNNLLPVLYLKD